MVGTSLDRHIWSCFGLNMSKPWFLRRSDPDELGRLQTRPWVEIGTAKLEPLQYGAEGFFKGTSRWALKVI